jgi:hypothetical protein
MGLPHLHITTEAPLTFPVPSLPRRGRSGGGGERGPSGTRMEQLHCAAEHGQSGGDGSDDGAERGQGREGCEGSTAGGPHLEISCSRSACSSVLVCLTDLSGDLYAGFCSVFMPANSSSSAADSSSGSSSTPSMRSLPSGVTCTRDSRSSFPRAFHLASCCSASCDALAARSWAPPRPRPPVSAVQPTRTHVPTYPNPFLTTRLESGVHMRQRVQRVGTCAVPRLLLHIKTGRGVCTAGEHPAPPSVCTAREYPPSVR